MDNDTKRYDWIVNTPSDMIFKADQADGDLGCGGVWVTAEDVENGVIGIDGGEDLEVPVAIVIECLRVCGYRVVREEADPEGV